MFIFTGLIDLPVSINDRVSSTLDVLWIQKESKQKKTEITKKEWMGGACYIQNLLGGVGKGGGQRQGY